jgi:hypothetical protein
MFILSIVTIMMCQYKPNETLVNKEKWLLIGDSILNNKNYVFEKESVEYILTNKYNFLLTNYAEDGEHLNELQDKVFQLNDIELNSSIVISIGGNDILRNRDVNKTFEKYKNVVKQISIKFPECNLYILDLYYPPCCRFKKYYDKITTWNNKLNKLKTIENVRIINISQLLTSKNDFVFEIEPSYLGGLKIAKKINEMIQHSSSSYFNTF